MNEHAGKQLKASTFGDESVLPHPSGLVEILFERMPMGIAVFDQDLRLCRFNPTWHEYVSRYGPVHAPIEPGAYYFDLMKGLEAQVMPLFERVLHGEALHFEAFPLSAGEITSYWDVVLAPLTEDGDVVGILNVTTDVTERVLAKDALAESQRMLSSLISNLTGMAYRWRIEEDWTM